MIQQHDKRFVVVWLLAFGVTLSWSAWQPHDFVTWLLEVFPVLVGIVVMAVSCRTFPLTRLLYVLILLHMIVLMIGGHYTYAHMPLFDMLKDLFGWSRNYYDRLGHWFQGFVPAIITREILIRHMVVKSAGWLFFITCCICLAISACYELIEWWVAIIIGQDADAFLATQGDVWDTQWDMLLALCGAIIAQLLLARRHRRAIASLTV